MSSQDFEFSLRVDAGPGAHALAEGVAAEVFRQVGCEDVAGAASALHAAIGEICSPTAACAVAFRAHGGTLEIVVSAGAASRSFWRPIP